MRSRWNRRGPRSLVSGVTLLALVVGWPVLLWSVAGWPLPGVVPDPGALQVAIEQRHIPAEVVINTLAVILWLLWAQLMWALIWELVVNGRRLGRGLRSAPAPFVVGPLNSLVAKLVSGVVAAGIIAGSSNAVVALPATPIVVTADEQPAESPEAARPAVVAAAEVAGTWLVADGDSLWSIAETTLGDGARSAELLALNPDLGSARALRPGMTLALPVGASVPAEQATVTERSSGAAGRSQATTVEVRSGDNLWHLSEQRLGATDPAVSDASIASYVGDVVAGNPAEITDPDLIHPGQVLRFPAIDRGDPEAEPIDRPEAEAEASDRADESDQAEGGAGATVPRAGDPGHWSATAALGPAGPSVPTGSAGPGESAAGPTDPVEVTDLRPLISASDVVPVSLGAAGGLLAAGVLGGVRRRRRYRQAHRRPGTVPSAAGPELAGVEQVVLRLGDDPDAEWVRAALASLSARPVWQGEYVAQPVLARLDDASLTVELSGPDPMGAPLPWRSDDSGGSWSLARDTPCEELESFHSRPVTPTFVTLGVGVMVNLEAVGVLKIEGAGDGARSVARSIVHELATSPSAGTIDIRSTLALEGVEPHRLVQQQRAESLVPELVSWLDETERRLATERSSNAYASRVVSNGDSMAPVVVVTDGAGFVDLAGLVGRASKRSLPVAVVVVADTDEVMAEHVLSVEGSRAELAPWDIEFEVQSLSSGDARRIGELLADAAAGGEEPLSVGLAPAGGETEPVAEPPPGSTSSEAQIVVRVLGPVEVEGITTELTSLQLSLLTFLACNGPASKAVMVDALWDGQRISRSRFPNVLAELRARIGRDHLPEVAEGRYELIGVTTDLALFEEALGRTAGESDPAATASLRSAVELVVGEPLTAPGRRFWTWVDDHTHFAARVEALVADTAARLARLYRDADDLEQARWACERGLAASPSDENLVTLLTEVYLALGKRGSARRLVDGWEDRVSRMECGEPSDEPRRRLVG